jgi:hypothetical protein
MEFCVFLDTGLAKYNAPVGIKTNAQPVYDHLEGISPDPLRGDVIGGQGMPIGDKKEAPVLILKAYPVFQGPVQMTKMKTTRVPLTIVSTSFSTTTCPPR